MNVSFRWTIVVLAATAAVVFGISGCGSSGSPTQIQTQTPAFTLTAPSTVVSIAQGSSGTTTVTATISGGFDGTVSLTASELPTGITVVFKPATIPAPGSGSSTLTINVTSAVATGNYIFLVTGAGQGLTQKVQIPLTVTSASAPTPLLVGYLPDWDSDYSADATTLNFSKMTHLILAFAVPPACNGACTAQSNMTWALSSGVQSDAQIDALVTAAHNAGVKVLVSIGGGARASDTLIEQFYNAGLSTPLAASLDSYLTAHNLDGVDVDIEDPANMGTNYDTFVTALTTTLHSEDKIASVAVATWIWQNPPFPDNYNAPMANSTLLQYDLVGVMDYSFLGDATAAKYYSDTEASMQYFAGLGVPDSKMTVGVPFYGQNASGSISESYATILADYPNAGASNEVSGGSLDGGVELYYVGDALMAQETQLGAQQYGGVMIWELSQDAAPPDSLLTLIQNNL
ncbi:MAG: glycosyl hydrolase family 18 protein [Terracidiphilus sp.]|jgi:GH18 family chitinase